MVTLKYKPLKNLPPKNIRIATEIACLWVSVAKLLVLPVWGTVHISGLVYTSCYCSPKSYDVGIGGIGSDMSHITLISLFIINC